MHVMFTFFFGRQKLYSIINKNDSTRGTDD